MNKETIIKRSLKSLKKLPTNKVIEISHFIEFIYDKYNEEIEMQKGIERLIEKSASFSFLNEEEDIYKETDLIQKF